MAQRLYVAIEGSAEQDEVSMSMFSTALYDKSALVAEIRQEIATRLADPDDELSDDNVADTLDANGELTTNMYDGFGEVMYKIFEI